MPLRPIHASLGALIALFGIAGAPAAPVAALEAAPGDRLVFAHYYPWFDMNTWRQGITPDLPAQPYASADPAAMRHQVSTAADSGIDVFNVAWLGPGNPTDSNFRQLLPIAAQRGMSLTIGFETDSSFLGSPAAVRRGLRHIMENYAWQPGYLRYEGKPVIFFWRVGAVPQTGEGSAVAAWRAIRDEVDPNREALWIGEGDRFEFLQVFDGIYPYSIAWSRNIAGTLSTYASRTRAQAAALGIPKLWVATVMPGYDDSLTGRSDAFSRDRRNGDFYDESWNAALASQPDWVSITSWNEWVEGSQIEAGRSYGNHYLDITRWYAGAWKGVAEVPYPDGADETFALLSEDTAPSLAAAPLVVAAATGGKKRGLAKGKKR